MNQARELAEQQQRIEDEVRQLQPMGQNPHDRMVRLLQRKDQLAAAVQSLESQLDRMAREAGREQREAYRELDEAANTIRENKLKEKIRYSKGVVQGRSPEYAREFEGEITKDIARLQEEIGQAARALAGDSPEDKMEQAVRRAGELARGLEGLDERLRDRLRGGRAPGAEGQDGQQGQGGQAGEQGRGGEQGQRGEGGQGGQAGEGQEGDGAGDGGGAGGNMGDRFGVGGLDGPGGRGIARGRRLTEEEMRQYQREIRERRTDAEQLRRLLQGQGPGEQDLRRLIEGLRALESPRLFDDPAEFERLRQSVVEGMKQFEYALRRQVQGTDREQLFLSGSDDVPPGYRELVEEYYRSLSRSTRAPSQD
jgi:hypothetical protein